MTEYYDEKISAGSYDMNTWLRGGYDKGIITTIYGPAGSGKTNICLLVAVSQAGKGKKVIFIDTEGGFSSDRARQIIGKEKTKEEIEEVLKNILILKPTNFEEQKKSMERLLEEIKNPESIGAIIVDGMTMLYRLELGEKGTGKPGDEIITKEENIRSVNQELVKQMRTLAEIARKKNLAVIVTNQVYKKEEMTKLVGGDILQYWSKCLIELVNDNSRRKAVLTKHRSMKESTLPFYITDKGIKKRGWI
ncbi:DNA repair and recombination protein RadB [Candidatus Pacearchaeota archaeon CG10_big_fil_rev_8_21_14_0_10_35_13]|nr:MAG: DNA repair and recombination protein RadB [Candidatus Pacearchaeota archaeon CG10_big_fil_rev_8_21_14_0_10_35_13]